jgi:hypothetical protein
VRSHGLKKKPLVLVAWSQYPGTKANMLVFDCYPGGGANLVAVAKKRFPGLIDGASVARKRIRDLGVPFAEWREDWSWFDPTTTIGLRALRGAVTKATAPPPEGAIEAPIRARHMIIYQKWRGDRLLAYLAWAGHPDSVTRVISAAGAPVTPWDPDPLSYEWFLGPGSFRGGPAPVRDRPAARRARVRALTPDPGSDNLESVRQILDVEVDSGPLRVRLVDLSRQLLLRQERGDTGFNVKELARDAAVSGTEIGKYIELLSDYAPLFFPLIIGAREVELARLSGDELDEWLVKRRLLRGRKFGRDRYRVELEFLFREVQGPAAPLPDAEELSILTGMESSRVKAVLAERRNDESLSRMSTDFGDREGEWGDGLKELRGSLSGGDFDLACVLVRCFLRGLAPPGSVALSKASGVDERTVRRHLKKVREEVDKRFPPVATPGDGQPGGV